MYVFSSIKLFKKTLNVPILYIPFGTFFEHLTVHVRLNSLQHLGIDLVQVPELVSLA